MIQGYAAGERLAHQLVRDRHVSDEHFDAFSRWNAPAHLQGAAERHEFRIALDIGDELKHLGGGVPDPARGGELRHHRAPSASVENGSRKSRRRNAALSASERSTMVRVQASWRSSAARIIGSYTR